MTLIIGKTVEASCSPSARVWLDQACKDRWTSDGFVVPVIHSKHDLSMEDPKLFPIGMLHGDMISPEETPKNFDESEKTGSLEIYPEYREGLDGIEVGQIIVVLFWLHKADRQTLKVYPRSDRSRGLRGVFSTRSPARPNPIAISELTVIACKEGRLEVRGIDIFDGTPIIDIKKKID